MFFSQLHIVKNYSHHRSSDKIWAQDGRLFRQNIVIFLRFSSMIMNFFSLIELNFVYIPTSPKNSKSLLLEVAKVLKWTLFSVRSLKLRPPLSPNFSSHPNFFFKVLTTGTKGCVTQKFEGFPDVILN